MIYFQETPGGKIWIFKPQLEPVLLTVSIYWATRSLICANSETFLWRTSERQSPIISKIEISLVGDYGMRGYAQNEMWTICTDALLKLNVHRYTKPKTIKRAVWATGGNLAGSEFFKIHIIFKYFPHVKDLEHIIGHRNRSSTGSLIRWRWSKVLDKYHPVRHINGPKMVVNCHLLWPDWLSYQVRW